MSKSKEPQQSSVKPYPEWKEGLPSGPQFGILSKLNGISEDGRR